MLIVGGPAANGVDERISKILGLKLVRPVYKRFPDGEAYFRIEESVEGEEVVVIQSTYPPQDSHLIEALLLVDALLEANVERVYLAVPYLAYARQDKKFLPGEPISIRAVLKCLKNVGVSALITVDPHSSKSVSYFEGPVIRESAIPELAEYARKLKVKGEIVVLSPDIGGVERAKNFARLVNAEFSYVEKERDRITGEVRVKPVDINVSNKTVFIVDDIISTGGTMAKASKVMLESGALNVYAFCTHPLLAPGALDRLLKAGISEVVATDTIPSPISKVTSANAIARGLKELLKG